jgi:hypothetical protein
VGAERYAANSRKVSVYEGKLVRGSSLTIGKARHCDKFIEDMSGGLKKEVMECKTPVLLLI